MRRGRYVVRRVHHERVEGVRRLGRLCRESEGAGHSRDEHAARDLVRVGLRVRARARARVWAGAGARARAWIRIRARVRVRVRVRVS